MSSIVLKKDQTKFDSACRDYYAFLKRGLNVFT